MKNGVPFTRLRLQHRMRPEISKMLEHIYINPKLENHESVMNFDNIKGVARNAFFVDHEESEVGYGEVTACMKKLSGPVAGSRSLRSLQNQSQGKCNGNRLNLASCN